MGSGSNTGARSISLPPHTRTPAVHWIYVKNRKHHAFDRVQEAHRRAG